MEGRPSPPGVLRVRDQCVYFHSSEEMPELLPGSVDVIVTSPPYNRGKRYHPSYDDHRPETEYLAFLGRVFRECHRVLSPTGVFFLNVGDGAEDQGKSERVCRAAEAAGFRRRQTLIWVKSLLGKGHFTPSGRGRSFANVFEYVFLLVKGPGYRLDPKAVGIPYADKSNVGRYSPVDRRDAGNVWFIPYEETTGATRKKGHEAPFPVGLPHRAIRCVPGASLVLDPFAGTGATLSAADALGIRGVGYEPYPDPALIQRRIDTPYVPREEILIPDLEKSVRFLAARAGPLPFPEGAGSSQRKRERWRVVRDVIQRLGGD